jgi:hypothetical protein
MVTFLAVLRCRETRIICTDSSSYARFASAILGTADGAARVLAHAELLLGLSRRYETIVPAGLGHVSRVANFKSGKVIIHADNGAAAAKLMQMSTSLCQLLA